MTTPGKIMLVSVACFGKRSEQVEGVGGCQRKKVLLYKVGFWKAPDCNKVAFHLYCSGAAHKFLQEPRIKGKLLLRKDCSWF